MSTMNSNTIFLLNATAQNESTKESLVGSGNGTSSTQPADKGDKTQAQSGGGYQMLIFMVLMIVIFWLLIIRPQKKRQKQIEEARNSLKKGDHIVTAGGIHGKITDIKETECMIEIANNVIIKIDKASIITEPTQAAKN